MLGITGQRGVSHQAKVATEVAPIVDISDVSDVNSYLNQKYLSGKQEGYIVLVKKGSRHSLYSATGSKPEDKWLPLEQAIISDSSALELIDTINAEVASASDTVEVNVTKERTVCIQTPMKDLSGDTVYRQELTANINLTLNENGSPSDTVKLNISIPNLPGTSGGSYYTIDNVLCTAFGEDSPVVANIDVNKATTNLITVTLRKETATDIKLSLVIRWSMPVEVV